MTDYTELKEALGHLVSLDCSKYVIEIGDLQAMIAENERLRFALKRIVKSTDGAFPVDHRIDVHVSTIELAKRTLWPDAEIGKPS